MLHAGKVAERGTHSELLELKGRYHAMWEKQTTIEKKAEEAVEAVQAGEEQQQES